MSIGTLAAESAKLATGEETGIADLGVRDRVICKLANDAIAAGAIPIALADGKVLIGDAGGEAAAQTLSGGATVTRAGVVTVVPTELAVADGKILIGAATGKAVACTPSGAVTMTNAGVFALSTSLFKKVTTAATTGEVVVAGMTSAGAVVLTALENVEAFYVTCGTGKITVKAVDDDAPITEKSFGMVVCALS